MRILWALRTTRRINIRRFHKSAVSSQLLIEEPKYSWLKDLGLDSDNKGVFDGTWKDGNGGTVESICPTNNEPIARISMGNVSDYNVAAEKAKEAWKFWCEVPGPNRGEIVRQIGHALREKKTLLGNLEALEVGKIAVEGAGEVQEFIDICDYAVGLSRMLPGQVFPSERTSRREDLKSKWKEGKGLSAKDLKTLECGEDCIEFAEIFSKGATAFSENTKILMYFSTVINPEDLEHCPDRFISFTDKMKNEGILSEASRRQKSSKETI